MTHNRFRGLLFSIVVICGLGLFGVPAQAAESVTQTVSGTTIQKYGKLFKFNSGLPRDAEVHIPKGSISSTVNFTWQKMGTSLDGTEVPYPYKKHRFFGESFHYKTSSTAVNTVILQFPYSATASNKNGRVDVMYRAPGGKWKRALTHVNVKRRMVRIVLPVAEADIAVAGALITPEQPRKSFTFKGFTQPLATRSVVVSDVDSGKILYQKKADEVRSIASLTKILTAITYIQLQPNLDRVITYKASSNRIGARVYINDKETISGKQALMGALIPSANNMAETLAVSAGMSEKKFVSVMNRNAKRFSGKKTRILEPTGLNPGNVSTAREMDTIARIAFALHPELFQEAANAHVYNYYTRNTNRSIHLYSTNKFNGHGRFDVTAYKTGYLPGSADRTLIIQLKERRTGKKILVTLLGDPNYGSIFQEAYALAVWACDQWEYPSHPDFL